MFYKKRIEHLEQITNRLKDEISSLNEKVFESNNSLDKILETLESKNFSKDWEEYQKWKKMKDKLPGIEEMYQLKKLKELINKKSLYFNKIERERSGIVEAEADQLSGHRERVALKTHLKETLIQYETILTELSSVLDYIRKKSNQKDLIGIFKLYGISTEWLQP